MRRLFAYARGRPWTVQKVAPWIPAGQSARQIAESAVRSARAALSTTPLRDLVFTDVCPHGRTESVMLDGESYRHCLTCFRLERT